MAEDDLDVTARESPKDPDATEKNDISSPEVVPPASVPPAAASSSSQVAPPRRPASSSGEVSPVPPSLSRTSVPPSEPRPASRGSFSQLDLAAADRPARLQMIVALVLGLVLVAIPLYLWRRPRADAVMSTGDAADLAPPPPPATNEDKPAISEIRILACQDPGPKKTSPGECDHLADVEKAFTKAIEDSASCITKDLGGGSIEYVVDVSFRQKKIIVLTPKEGHTLRNPKAVSVCQAAVKSRLAAVPLDAVQHQHARYKLSATATYAGPVK